MTVILANGDFPKPGTMAARLLASAERVVACDGAADVYRQHFGRAPSLIVGDMDSFSPSAQLPIAIKVAEQETNDLAKAVRVCRERGWLDLVILGATGKREDHTLGNIFRAMEFGIEVVTDFGRFVPVSDHAEFSVGKGAAVSVFATNPATRVASTGLEWPLDDVEFRNLYCATLNRATAEKVTLTTSHPIFVYFPLDCDVDGLGQAG